VSVEFFFSISAFLLGCARVCSTLALRLCIDSHSVLLPLCFSSSCTSLYPSSVLSSGFSNTVRVVSEEVEKGLRPPRWLSRSHSSDQPAAERASVSEHDGMDSGESCDELDESTFENTSLTRAGCFLCALLGVRHRSHRFAVWTHGCRALVTHSCSTLHRG
jgi:hypothetical protein